MCEKELCNFATPHPPPILDDENQPRPSSRATSPRPTAQRSVTGMAEMLLVKWGKEADALAIPEGRTAHAIVSERFGIPLKRLTLVHRGKKYPNDLAATKELLMLSAKGQTILVIGTALSAQLDEPQGEVLATVARLPLIGRPTAHLLLNVFSLTLRCWNLVVPRVFSFTANAGRFAYLFVASLLPFPSRRSHTD